MRLVMIIVIALLVLGGGGAGAYFYFHHPAEAAVGKAAEEAPAKADAKEDLTVFVAMDPLILPIIGPDGVTQTVSLVISLEVPDPKNEEVVKHLSPRLKDAYIQDMYGVLSRKNAMPNGMLQVGMIKDRLNHISQDVLGKDIVKNVLLQVVQQHKV